MTAQIEFPQRLFSFPSKAMKEWELADGLYARIDIEQVGTLPDEVERIDAKTVICRVGEQGVPEHKDFVPVYRLAVGEALCVPTGLIFVVLNKGHTIAECSNQISDIGFSIEKQSSAGGAWLRHQSGLQQSLQAYPKLAKIEALRSVEPQFLMQRAAKPKSRRPSSFPR